MDRDETQGLIDRYRAGDSKAAEELLKQYAPLLKRVYASLIGTSVVRAGEYVGQALHQIQRRGKDIGWFLSQLRCHDRSEIELTTQEAFLEALHDTGWVRAYPNYLCQSLLELVGENSAIGLDSCPEPAVEDEYDLGWDEDLYPEIAELSEDEQAFLTLRARCNGDNQLMAEYLGWPPNQVYGEWLRLKRLLRRQRKRREER